MNKGGKFLNNLWCCIIGPGVLQDDLILSTELIMKIFNRKDFVKLTFPTLALRRAIVQVWCGTHRTLEAKGV